MTAEPPPAPLQLAGLPALMARTGGSPDVAVALLDGPVATEHPDFAGARMSAVAGGGEIACGDPSDDACAHGTFVAGMLVARRESRAPALCPGCSLMVRPIFRGGDATEIPTATPAEVARAIVESVDADARVINLSAGTEAPSTRAEADLHAALDKATSRGAIVVAAAGNQAALGSSAITRHPGVIAVAGVDRNGRPMRASNLSASIGRRGLAAPGDGIVSLGAAGEVVERSGTSFAAAFVTGAIALLWSLFPAAHANEIRQAVAHHGRRRTGVVPPLLDAEAAYRALAGGAAATAASGGLAMRRLRH